MKTKINKADKKQGEGNNIRNGVFWCIFLVFVVVTGIAGWQLYGEVSAPLGY